ncbi:MAG TPA: glutathione S-transferase family protein [Burkholderiaceae bacterium]
MQNTELDPILSQVLGDPKKSGMKLVIGNKRYSSWSMRPWLVMTAFHVPFEEIKVRLRRPDSASRIAEYSLSGRVPVLIDGDITVWDSLAICEYLAEQFPEKAMWPENVMQRAMARSMCAEMHSGFTDLRNAMWMNVDARFPGKGRTPGAQADIGRISEMWEECLAMSSPHGYLFGDFSIADAYFAPVVTRFLTYDVSLAPMLQAYVERVAGHFAVARWLREAQAETDRVEELDSYPD